MYSPADYLQDDEVPESSDEGTFVPFPDEIDDRFDDEKEEEA